MRNDELVLWAYSITRAYNAMRGYESRIYFAEWGAELSLMWMDRKLRRVERLVRKAKVN